MSEESISYDQLVEEHGTGRAYKIHQRAHQIAKQHEALEVRAEHVALAIHQLKQEMDIMDFDDGEFIMFIHDYLRDSGIEEEHIFMKRLIRIFLRLNTKTEDNLLTE